MNDPAWLLLIYGQMSLLAVGAAAYGPTSGALQGRLAKRVRQVLAVDLVAGLDPLLLAERDVPDYIEVDHSKMTARVTRVPGLGEVPYPVQMEPNLVIEFYSR